MAQAADILLIPDVGTNTLWYKKITPEDVVGIGKALPQVSTIVS
jgi:hypothetical protein